ncbi:hypothetical protein HH308_12190 [Gordonia sp. TBRC 11910]|uniref:Septum formation-related domain-containing protein n=1 Tax=Gordonia asplenii TaxID=2725283 RepID=A0A848L0G1_9ACTN|nr:septum formation family protein [Gordonia asplenii]NMO01971.1 hypothetical protein [Gordonia asplenii]
MTQPPPGWNQPAGPYPQGPYQQPGYPAPYPGAQPPTAPYGYPGPARPQSTNGLAIAAFVLSLIPALVFLPLILGIVAAGQCRRRGQPGRGLALAAIWISVGWVVVGLVVVGLSAVFNASSTSNTITAPTTSTIDVFSAKVSIGDCISSLDLSARDSSGASTVGDPDIVACSSAHHAEVFDKFTTTETTLPSDSEMERLGNQCVEKLKTYSPASYSDPAIDVKYVYPLPRTWAEGDRTIVCVATVSTARTSSLKGN